MGAGIEIEVRFLGLSGWFDKGAPGSELFGFIRHKERVSLERLVLGVMELFGGLLSLGGVMPLGRFLCGFVGKQLRVVLGVTEALWKLFGFSGARGRVQWERCLA